ncbi:hypothetical protein G7046_g5421 [Stylonectria norvegica]|nr:hypothetical protein G7046_g5421 [Stylonectria norvegica]
MAPAIGEASRTSISRDRHANNLTLRQPTKADLPPEPLGATTDSRRRSYNPLLPEITREVVRSDSIDSLQSTKSEISSPSDGDRIRDAFSRYPPRRRNEYPSGGENIYYHSRVPPASIDLFPFLNAYANEGAELVDYLAENKQYCMQANERAQAQRARIDSTRKLLRSLEKKMAARDPRKPHLRPTPEEKIQHMALKQLLERYEIEHIAMLQTLYCNQAVSQGVIAGHFAFGTDDDQGKITSEQTSLLIDTRMIPASTDSIQAIIDSMDPLRTTPHKSLIDVMHSLNRRLREKAYEANRQRPKPKFLSDSSEKAVGLDDLALQKFPEPISFDIVPGDPEPLKVLTAKVKDMMDQLKKEEETQLVAERQQLQLESEHEQATEQAGINLGIIPFKSRLRGVR